jgi:hypothetical protein
MHSLLKILDELKIVLCHRITNISQNGSGTLYRKKITTKFFDRKAILPKHHLTEHRLTECHLTEKTFDRIAV